MSRATIHYGPLTYTAPSEVGENLIDVLLGLEDLGGSHLFPLGGGDEGRIRLWITKGTPIAVHFEPGYETPEDREGYVETRLKQEARYRLGLPMTDDPAPDA